MNNISYENEVLKIEEDVTYLKIGSLKELSNSDNGLKEEASSYTKAQIQEVVVSEDIPTYYEGNQSFVGAANNVLGF